MTQSDIDELEAKGISLEFKNNEIFAKTNINGSSYVFRIEDDGWAKSTILKAFERVVEKYVEVT